VAVGYGEFGPEGNVFEPVIARFSETIAGKRLTMRDVPGRARTLRVVAEDESILPNARGGAGDPTISGATFVVENPDTGERATVDLPASGWRVRRTRTPGSGRYLFRGSGPCRSLRVQPGGWKASCADLGFTLDEPSQGRLVVRLAVTDGPRWCVAFGGVLAADVPGRFDAREAPAPVACD
jgi:hypothetical protein